MDEDD